MQSYILMTDEQTETYDADGSAAVSLMAELKTEAQQLANSLGRTVEIFTADGIVAAAVNSLD